MSELRRGMDFDSSSMVGEKRSGPPQNMNQGPISRVGPAREQHQADVDAVHRFRRLQKLLEEGRQTKAVSLLRKRVQEGLVVPSDGKFVRVGGLGGLGETHSRQRVGKDYGPR